MASQGFSRKRSHEDVEDGDECLPISKRINSLHIEGRTPVSLQESHASCPGPSAGPRCPVPPISCGGSSPDLPHVLFTNTGDHQAQQVAAHGLPTIDELDAGAYAHHTSHNSQVNGHSDSSHRYFPSVSHGSHRQSHHAQYINHTFNQMTDTLANGDSHGPDQRPLIFPGQQLPSESLSPLPSSLPSSLQQPNGNDIHYAQPYSHHNNSLQLPHHHQGDVHPHLHGASQQLTHLPQSQVLTNTDSAIESLQGLAVTPFRDLHSHQQLPQQDCNSHLFPDHNGNVSGIDLNREGIPPEFPADFELEQRPTGVYEPELDITENPFYFTANRTLYEAHVSRMRRQTQ